MKFMLEKSFLFKIQPLPLLHFFVYAYSFLILVVGDHNI